jgi:hypothetical protein
MLKKSGYDDKIFDFEKMPIPDIPEVFLISLIAGG